MVRFAGGEGWARRLRGFLFVVPVWIEGIYFVTGIAITDSRSNGSKWGKHNVRWERDYKPPGECRRVFRASL